MEILDDDLVTLLRDNFKDHFCNKCVFRQNCKMLITTITGDECITIKCENFHEKVEEI